MHQAIWRSLGVLARNTFDMVVQDMTIAHQHCLGQATVVGRV
jgi:hypothetical protein